MSEHWTDVLSEEGSEEILREQSERAVETPQRREMLQRVRDALRILGHQGAQGALREDRTTIRP